MASTVPDAPTRKIRFCSVISAQSGEDTAGSAWHIPHYVMIELPLPWSYNSLESPHAPKDLGPLLVELWGRGIHWGFVGIAPDHAWSVPGKTRILDYLLPEAPFGGFAAREYLLPTGRVVELLRAAALEPGSRPLEPFAVKEDVPQRNLFVCTHGAIDACCATFGYPLYKLLRQMSNDSDYPFRVWRCTHFGGHRFAATLLEMPQGRYWGHLDARDLGPLITREGPASNLRHRYRGWAALEHPLLQVAEAAVLEHVGWSWTACAVTPDPAPVPNAGDSGPWTFRFRYSHPGTATSGHVDIEVSETETVRTMHTSQSEEFEEVMQYATRIVSATPAKLLADPAAT